jgi:hypothetical protein
VQETTKAKRGVELLIDRAKSTRREKWEIKATKRGARKQRPRIKSGSHLGKMLLSGKRNKEWLNTVVLSGPKN